MFIKTDCDSPCKRGGDSAPRSNTQYLDQSQYWVGNSLAPLSRFRRLRVHGTSVSPEIVSNDTVVLMLTKLIRLFILLILSVVGFVYIARRWSTPVPFGPLALIQ